MAIDIETRFIEFKTRGRTDIIDITEKINNELKESGYQEGNITVFGIGSTTGIGTIEYEPGLVNYDISRFWENTVPYKFPYEHNKTWGDDNGSSHVRSTVQGSSLVVPFHKGALLLGTWQQIIFIDFDTRPRKRKVVVQIIGKK